MVDIMWREIPFWKKTLWASVLLTGIEECQRKSTIPEEIGYNQRPHIQTEYNIALMKDVNYTNRGGNKG